MDVHHSASAQKKVRKHDRDKKCKYQEQIQNSHAEKHASKTEEKSSCSMRIFRVVFHDLLQAIFAQDVNGYPKSLELIQSQVF